MSRLPTPGSDNGTWGEVLNDFLSQAHNGDGTLKDTGVIASKAPLANPTFSGTVTVPTPTSATDAATKAYVDSTASAAAADATTSSKGIVQLAGDLSGTASSPTVPGLASKEPTITAGTTTQYWRGDKSWQTLDKTTVGLSNVDNTSDANKPVSTATTTALAGKVDKSTLTTKGDLYVASAASTPTRLAVGSNNQVLTADSTQATGVKWATPTATDSTAIHQGDYALNAKDYGAVGNGSTDDTTALQAWLDAAKSQKRPAYLPAGRYRITATLNFTQIRGWRIYGDGPATITSTSGSRLEWGGSVGGTMMLLQGVYGGSLSYITFYGGDSAGIGLDYDAVSSGIVTSENEIRRIELNRCTIAGVRIGASAFQADQTSWVDCAFHYCQDSTTPAAGSGTACGVRIQDANAVWHHFRGCVWQHCDIGISAVESGTGGHFGITGGRFVGQNVVDIKPYPARAVMISDTHSENSYQFLLGSASSNAIGPVTLAGCSVNQVTHANGRGIDWNRAIPLTIIGGSYTNNATPAQPFRIRVGNGSNKGTCVAKGVVFRDGNPFAADNNVTTAHISAEDCIYSSTVSGTTVPSNNGLIPYGTPVSPAATLNASVASATQTYWADLVWVRVTSGTVMSAGANVFYVLNKNCNGNCRPRLENIQTTGGSDAVLLGIHGIDDNATTTNAAKITLRFSGSFTLTSDLVFAVAFRNEPINY